MTLISLQRFTLTLSLSGGLLWAVACLLPPRLPLAVLPPYHDHEIKRRPASRRSIPRRTPLRVTPAHRWLNRVRPVNTGRSSSAPMLYNCPSFDVLAADSSPEFASTSECAVRSHSLLTSCVIRWCTCPFRCPRSSLPTSRMIFCFYHESLAHQKRISIRFLLFSASRNTMNRLSEAKIETKSTDYSV